MEGKVLTTGSLSDWREYFQRLDHSGPYHDPDYLTAVATYLEGPAAEPELFVYDGSDSFIYYPYIRRPLSELEIAEEVEVDLSKYSDLISSWYYGGPVLVGDDPNPALVSEFADAFDKRCEDDGIVSEFVRFDPNIKNHETFGVFDPEPDLTTVPVDLTRSEDAIWEDFEKRNRNAIRQARNTDLVAEPTTDSKDYRAFYDIYSNAMEAKGAGEAYRFDYDFFETLFSNSDLSSLVVARYEGAVIGGSMIVHDETVAHDYLRASNPDYWDMRVNNLLCYRSLMHMRETGRDLFDFQGGRPGVFKFKKQFSKTGRGEFHISGRIHLPDLYETLADAAGAGVDADFFPAYRS